MEQVIALAALGFFASKLLEMVKYVRAKDWNAAITLLSLWFVGIIVVTVAAHNELTEDVILPQTTIPLGELGAVALGFLGMILTSLVSVTYDFKKAIDSSDSAKQPPLIDSSGATDVG